MHLSSRMRDHNINRCATVVRLAFKPHQQRSFYVNCLNLLC